MVCRGLSVCRSVTVVSPAKTAEPIEILFFVEGSGKLVGPRARVSPGNHILDGGPHPPIGRGILRGEGAA